LQRCKGPQRSSVPLYNCKQVKFYEPNNLYTTNKVCKIRSLLEVDLKAVIFGNTMRSETPGQASLGVKLFLKQNSILFSIYSSTDFTAFVFTG